MKPAGQSRATDNIPEARKRAENASAGLRSRIFGCRFGRAPFRETGDVIADKNAARVFALEQASLVIGAILLLGLTFYVGQKFAYWKYVFMTRHTPTLSEMSLDKFPGVSSDELLEQALVAEHAGNWQDAVERLMAAKHKNPSLPGILFHVGQLLFQDDNYDKADEAFESAIAFGEDIDTANYSRGMIATRRRNFPGAERFFEAAATAKPLVADYYFYWAEALRLDSHPREAISRYEQAAHRAGRALDEKVLGFKIRVAEIEAGGSSKVSAELDEKRRAGPLSVDLVMTAAALKLREGRIDEAVQLLSTARSGNDPGLFAACVQDICFRDASAVYSQVANACEPGVDLASKLP